MRPRYFLLILSAFLSLSASAQKYRITGRVMDSETGDPLINATVQVLKADSTGLLGGDVTNNMGGFTVKNMAAGDYVVKISYIGYHNFYHKVSVQEKQKESNVGTVMMLPSSVLLNQAVVTAKMPQVEVREDTLIFNADAFKVPEGSVLEELIRKLPGAEVSSDGTIKINGKTVKKILVEGKEFFGSDKSMAMKNLPSEIVDKVKTYDKQSDMAKMTGIDDGEEETVIDLTIKKGMKKGWFGNFDLAGGTEDRYSVGGMLSRFSDSNQVSLMGNYGNATRGGFGSRERRGGSGDQTSGQGGINIALERGKDVQRADGRTEKSLKIGGNVRYNGSKSTNWTRTSSQNFITTTASFSNSYNASKSRSHSTNGDFRLEWAPDSMTTLMFRPNFSFGGNSSTSGGQSATFNQDPYNKEYALGGTEVENPLDEIDQLADSIKVNYNNTANRSNGDNYSLGGNLIVNRRLNSKGRNFSINLNGSYSDNQSKSYSLSDVRYFQYGDSSLLTYRYRTTPNTSASYRLGFNYTEPLIAKKLFLSLNYRFDYSKRHSDGKAYDMGSVAQLMDSIRNTGAGFLPDNYRQYLDDDLSRYTDNWNYVHNIELQLRYVTNAINLRVGVLIEPQRQKVKYDYQGLDTVASRTFSRISPTLNFRYRFSKQHTLRIRYRGTSSQPSMTDMFSMTDDSDPLNIRMGNPELKPSVSHQVNVDWNNYVSATLQNFNANFSLNTTQNSISNRTEYNESTGGRITQPRNINGNWNMNGNFGFNTPLFTENFYVNTSTSAGYNNNVGYIYQNQQTLKNTVKNTSLSERLSLNYREDYWDVGLTGGISYSHVRSKLVPTNNRDTYDFNYGLTANMNLENGLGASTNIYMSSRRGYSSSAMNTNELIWNAQVSYRLLKSKALTLSLQAYDILNRQSNFSRTISATSRTDTESYTLHSYVMCRAIYRFNLFGTRAARREMRERRAELQDY